MITLRNDQFRAEISPAHGGILAGLAWTGPGGGEHALLYRGTGEMPTTAAPNFMGLWAMLPFANRAFDCLIDDGGQPFTVPVNDPVNTGNIHGFGWQAAWTVIEQTASSIVMTHERARHEDPYVYQAQMRITLDDGLLSISLSVTNRSDRTLPFGMGFHPWFNAAPDSCFSFASRGALAFGSMFRAVGLVTHAEGGPFAHGVMVGAQEHELAVSAIDWTGEAVLSTPSLGLALHVDASPNLRHPVLWAPARANFVCFEPQSHCIGAPSLPVARAITPLVQLKPDETLDGWMTIRPEEI